MRINDLFLGLIMLVLGLAIALHAQTFPVMAGMQYGPEFFPTLIGTGIALCGLGMVVRGVVDARAGADEPWVTVPDWMRVRINVLRALGILGAVVFYIVASPVLGFMLTIFVTTLGLLLLLANPLWLSMGVAVALPVVLHFGFSVGLRVPLPRGIIEKLLI
ncbi:tripartite tricarboxylate transporter TctB family protein [uncultured Roseobacter sp.]|uniref:tripartite tricarboxylate transporter TctB family protein n=1 Tax=uncultured Roseobacter sp. TaxID=114847 RepID=UPI00260989CD|nr:tripartite tricarboxylate transporter TctB family protein [uncultured Roseobacter sp.]